MIIINNYEKFRNIRNFNSVERLLDIDFEIFKEFENADYIKFSDVGKYPDYSLVEIYAKKYLVNEKQFNSILDDLYKNYQTIMGIKFDYLEQINLNLISIIKPLCENKEVLLYFATKGN